ncbi:phage terminase large subunit family protein [Deinococcus cellulosilyticus]|uniref:Phage terminase large subunit GpA ATPase domain-containing protein n=1 Tax=Deinococcus cellulosilyticus (strain DSM 18568 / NBRC 106333 / KACC 11606 / 5516J-15) TaxID=1223518 RepID=A0A511N815_DEIC1|nr:phage terminase large subunit family protein [Deinococcus cellulosilyticus]GEM48647.1 hypothetical protein DC3_42820 [Deinococcus cellulosilyticus NBRC 106333 = KACC 11606]
MSLWLPPEYQQQLESKLFRPRPVFDAQQLESFADWIPISGIRPEGPGGARFDLSTRPYLRDLYTEQRSNPRRRIVIMKAAQTGLTVRMLYRSAWWCADARKRVNTALLFPTKDAVSDLHSSRFRPMMLGSSKMMQLIGDGGVDQVGLVRMGVSNMRFRGMRSGVGLDSFPADVLEFDEVRLMDERAIPRAFVRVSESKIVSPEGLRGIIELNSTAGFPKRTIDMWFQRSTMNYWRTPCPSPHCKNHELGIIMPLRWPDCVGREGKRVYYCCPDCGTEIPDSWLLMQGWYQPENPGALWEGYQFSQILKGNGFLQELWAEYLSGDNLQEFYNSRLGIPWMDPDAVPVTKQVLESCIDDSGGYYYPEPQQVQGEWVSMGIDQRAGEKHVSIWKLGEGRTFDLVHLEVVEKSGHAAVMACKELALRFHAKIVVTDGEPSYDFAIDLSRELEGIVWLADYTNERPQRIEFLDERKKTTTKKVSGEVKTNLRVLLERYTFTDWALKQFQAKRVRLPLDFYALHQERTLGGVPQNWNVAEEYQLHMENYARASEPKYIRLKDEAPIFSGQYRRVYRMVGLDPHFAHSTVFAFAGLVYGGGDPTTFFLSGGDTGPGVDSNGIPDAMNIEALEKQAESLLANTCGMCKHWQHLQGTKGRCNNKHGEFFRAITQQDAPKCKYWSKKS